MNREFLMLAKVFDPNKHKIAGWYASEKLDGQRCFWDGGVSRGKPTIEVPWANLERKIKPVATGLWSRYGNVIVAPDSVLDLLPPRVHLDVELYCGNFQTLRTIVSTDIANEEDWKEVKFMIIDEPGYEVFESGRINNPNFSKMIDVKACHAFSGVTGVSRQAQSIFPYLRERYVSERVRALEQIKLPNSESKALDYLYEMLDGVVSSGGEGIILRDPRSFWVPKRVPTLLKVKPLKDSEGVVVSYRDGTGRLQGMLGALVVEWNGKRFEIGTGFTDAERKESLYPVGSVITFKYSGLTNDGIPREARFHRSFK